MEWVEFDPESTGSLERGQFVVVRTSRGEELGEVLLVAGESASGLHAEVGPKAFRSQILRVANEADQERASIAEAIRNTRFEECRSLLEDGRWPVELLDVELLMDGRTTIVELLKEDDFSLTALYAQFRSWYDYEVVLEYSARENEAAILIPADQSLMKTASSSECGNGCGSSGCGCRPSSPSARAWS